MVDRPRSDGARVNARIAALDVEEPLGSHVGPEAGLGEQEVTGTNGHLVGHDRRVAGSDVAERPAVHQRRGALQSLHQVGFDGLL